MSVPIELINEEQISVDKTNTLNKEVKRDFFKSEEFKIVYSVSDVRDLIRDTICSVNTLSNFVSKEDIILFYTPPRSNRNYKKLLKFGSVIKVDNLTDKIDLRKGAGRYGDKFHALYVESPNMIFLDSDTIIRGDPSSHLGEDYEFSGRIAPNFWNLDIEVWNKMFTDLGKKPIPMINTGYMIFQNYTHNKIADEVIDYMYSELPRPDRYSNQKDQYALSLAVSDKDIYWMDNNMHSFLWRNEFKGKVLHGSVPKMGSDVKMLYNRMKIRIQRYFLPRLY